MEGERLKEIVAPWEEKMKELLVELSEEDGNSLQVKLKDLASSSSTIISRLLSKLVKIDRSLHKDQLLHKHNHIAYQNCTLANGCLQRWITDNNCAVSSSAVCGSSGNGGMNIRPESSVLQTLSAWTVFTKLRTYHLAHEGFGGGGPHTA